MYISPYEEIDTELKGLLALCVPDENGELPENIDEIEQRIADLLGEQYDRGEAICRAYLNYQANAAAIKAEEQRLKERRERAEKSADRLLELLSKYFGEGCHQFGAFVFSSKKTPATIRYSDGMSEDKLLNILRGVGSPYVVEKTTYSLDKKPLKKALEEKEIELAGVTLERGTAYSIK